MFRKGNILAKSQWMGIAALIMAMIMFLDPVLSLAEEGGSDDEIVIFSSEGEEIEFGGTGVYGELSGGTQSQGSVRDMSEPDKESVADILNEDEIWALVDYDELRSLVDVKSLRSSIDEPALLDSIDRDELRSAIDGNELLAGFSEEELEEEFIERKLEGENFAIDEYGQPVIVDEEGTRFTAKENLHEDGEETSMNSEVENYQDTAEKSDEESVGESYESVPEDADNGESEPGRTLSEILSEDTIVLEDGREIKSVRVRFFQEMLEDHPVDIVKTQLPIIGDVSPFDFVIDPMNFLYQSAPEGTVEENASVLFKNTQGEYNFSHRSDMIRFVNKGNVPVKLVITASIQNPDSVPLVDSAYELSGKKPGLFMALADEVGISSVITSYSDAVIETVLKPVPDGTYVFRYNEETGKYSYTLVDEAEESEASETDAEDSIDDMEQIDTETSESEEDSRFDSYSFGVVGACNTEADWNSVTSRPVIDFSWKVEPILSDWDDLTDQLEAELRAHLLEDREEFEVFKLVKAKELVEEKFIELLQVKFEELKEKELERLIKEEVLKLALVQIAEMRESDNDNHDGIEAEEKSGDEGNSVENTEDLSIVNSGGDENGADESAESKDTVEITSDGDTIIIPETHSPPDAKPPESDGVEFLESDSD